MRKAGPLERQTDFKNGTARPAMPQLQFPEDWSAPWTPTEAIGY